MTLKEQTSLKQELQCYRDAYERSTRHETESWLRASKAEQELKTFRTGVIIASLVFVLPPIIGLFVLYSGTIIQIVAGKL